MYVKNRKQTLESIIIGYTKNDIEVELTTDEFGRIYIPNIGWLHTSYKETNLKLHSKELKLLKNDSPIDFKYELIYYIENTKIELLKYSIPFEKYAPKCVIFKADTNKRNSFATFAANGISFFNAYQSDYDEVFFIDDIAHQTGHIIFNTLTYDISKFLKISSTTIFETINLPNGTPVEKRSIHVVLHALYTYYTTFICLDACMYSLQKKQQHEAIGRIAFYLNKCYNDLLLIDNPINSEVKSNAIFTKMGFKVYKEIKMKWFEMFYKWHTEIATFDMSNQPYNFTYSKFIELNPLINK